MERIVADRYELEERLGASGMSEVWCAVDRKLERRVALKLLAPQADTSRFEREAYAVASLAHPNVVRLYDYGEDATRPYIVLELLSGGTLAERLIRDQPLGDGETLSIARDVAAALAHAHAHGIVHRDLKPANVLFDDEGRAKLADFGIASFVLDAGALTEAGTLIGTASYMSPEQAAGEAATPASDVYSFGVILYQMLTGRLPFEAADPLEVAALHRTASPPPVSLQRSELPPELETTTTAALAKSPAERPADGQALLAALGGLADTGTSAATPMPAPALTPPALTAAETAALPAPALQRERRKRPLFLAATALAALALAGVVLALVVSRPGGSSPGRITFPATSAAEAKTQNTTRRSTPVTGAPAPSPQTSTRSKTPHAATTQSRTAQRTTPRGVGATPSSATTGQATTATQEAVSTEAATVSVTTPAGTTTAPATGTTTTTTPATTASTTTASVTTTTAATAATTTG